jgi:hypothetical protein
VASAVTGRESRSETGCQWSEENFESRQATESATNETIRTTDAHDRPAAPVRTEGAEAAAPVYPKVEWHHARSVGLAYAGYLTPVCSSPFTR